MLLYFVQDKREADLLFQALDAVLFFVPNKKGADDHTLGYSICAYFVLGKREKQI